VPSLTAWEKPGLPRGHHRASLEEKMSEHIYLGLGSNLGERIDNLSRAVSLLSKIMEIKKVSPVYQTKPWGFTEQPEFLNQVISGLTALEPEALLDKTRRIELEMGRKTTFHYGPRIIDIDILFFAVRVIDQPGLTIPHPHIAERAFVLVPLADIAPNFIHPVLGRKIVELLSKVDSTSVARYDPGS